MPRLLFAAAVTAASSVTMVTFAALVPACSSSNASSSEDAGDAAIPPLQYAGQPCDPSLKNPCAVPPPCYRNVCDPVQLVCVQSVGSCTAPDAAGLIGHDAASDARVGSLTCYRDSDCHTGLRCGYPIADVCKATGSCVSPEVPLTDAGQPYTACGCNGQSVNYVTQNMTAAPVSSPVPCAEIGPEAGLDAAADASDAGQPSVDSGPDASSDTGAQAPGDASSDAAGD